MTVYDQIRHETVRYVWVRRYGGDLVVPDATDLFLWMRNTQNGGGSPRVRNRIKRGTKIDVANTPCSCPACRC